MIPGLRKCRYLLAAQPDVLMRVCIAVALLSVVGAGITFATPPTIEVTTTTDRQLITTDLQSQATVEQQSSLYPIGENLSNMPVYARSITPNVTISAVTTPPPGERMSVEQRLSVVYEARTARGELFWQQKRHLRQTSNVTTGQHVVTSTLLNIQRIDRRIARLESEIGDAGQITVYLEVESLYETKSQNGVLKQRGAIHLREDSYALDHLSVQDAYGETEHMRQPAPSKIVRLSLPVLGALVIPHTTLVFALTGIGALVGIGLVVVFAKQLNPEVELAALHQARYDEWISPGTLPTQVAQGAIHMETLEDLVDVAIDSQKRIIYDRSQGLYAVVGGQTVYVYPETMEQVASQ